MPENIDLDSIVELNDLARDLLVRAGIELADLDRDRVRDASRFDQVVSLAKAIELRAIRYQLQRIS